MADLVDGVLALAVPAREAGQGESVAALSDHVQHLRVQVRRQTDRVGVVEGGARGGDGGDAEREDQQCQPYHLLASSI